jgi:Fibronectin type III domain
VRAATHAVTLTWTVPTANTDGSALVDLVGWTVRYGTDAANLSMIRLVNGASTTTLTIDGLAAGTYYFDVKARNAAGIESAPSATVKVALPSI